ncbi:MAG: hypothetical protein ABSC77_11175 [Terracidiphilus sp.]|jgi:hypothetical protein
MKIGHWAGLLVVAPLLAGCGDFWQNPNGSNSSFSLSNSGNITVSTGASGTSTITATPGSSFTGTITLSCSVTAPSGASSPATCSLSSSSLTFSSTTAQTATLTASTTTSTSSGAYQIKVSGVSGSVTESTTLCVAVGTGSCTSASGSGNFYILNSNQITGYSISSNSLTAISSGSASVTGALAAAMAPNGHFLCVSSTSAGVTAYRITSGALGSAAAVSSDLDALAIQVDPSNTWLVEAIPASGGVMFGAIYISSTTGAIAGSEYATPTFSVTNAAVQPNRMVISPDNSYIFLALGEGGTIVLPFNASAASGTSPFGTSPSPIYIPVAHSNGTALSVGVDPSSRLFYIGETLGDTAGTAGGLRAFNYSSLPSVSEISSSKIASGGLAPTFILPVTTPSYVYVADGAGSITGFAVSGSRSSYTLTTGSTVSAGAQPAGMAEDSTGAFVFEVGSTGSPYFDAYTFDATTTGQLDSQVTSTAAATSITIVAAP